MANIRWVGTGAAPNDWTHPDNWEDDAGASGVPVNDDDVYFEDNAVSVNTTTELAQSAVTLGSLNIGQSYTGEIGTSAVPLHIGADVVNVGYHNGPGTPTGSPLINLNLHIVETIVSVHNTGTSADASQSPLRIIGANDGSVLNLYKGSVELATEPGATSQFDKINVSYKTLASSDADLFIGSGMTLATLNMMGGDVFLECTATVATVNVHDGILTTSGAGDITALNALGGAVYPNSTGTIGTLDIKGSGSPLVDFTQSVAARIVTTLKLDPGGTLKWNPTYLTTTANPIPSTTILDVTYTAS